MPSWNTVHNENFEIWAFIRKAFDSMAGRRKCKYAFSCSSHSFLMGEGCDYAEKCGMQ